MNDYELEYYVSIEELKHRYIDEDTLQKVRKVRSKILRLALVIYTIFLVFVIYLMYHFLIRLPYETVSLGLGIAIIIAIIAMQKPCVDYIYIKLMKRKYKKHLTKEFIERLKDEHRYYEDW